MIELQAQELVDNEYIYCDRCGATTATNTGENPSTANANNAQTLSGSFTAERMGEGVGGLNLHPAGKYNSR